MNLAARLSAAAQAFLEGLDDERARAASLPFDEVERRTWAYWPVRRRGLALWSLDRSQTKAAHRLLATLLPVPAYTQAVAVMGLDEVLDRLEGYRGDVRHGDDYWVTIFGTPGREPWGLRFEGHHVSVHATLVGGEARVTPLFLGANPAVVRHRGLVVLAPLAPEEELGFALLHALSAEQRATALVAGTAPSDILSRNQARLDAVPPGGLPLARLTGQAADHAAALLELYLDRFPEGARRPDARDVAFAWAGADQPGAGHYYRLAGPRLLVELDNTQNGANHVHTVVRDPVADFGDDVLAAHHRREHPAPQL